MTFTFLGQQKVLEWPALDLGDSAYQPSTALSALAVTGDGAIVIADIVSDQAGLEMGQYGWWTHLRITTGAGPVLHPNIYQSTHYRNVSSMAAGEVSPGVVGVLLWETQEAYAVDSIPPPDRMLFFRVNAATGALLGMTIHPAVFDIPGTEMYLMAINNGQWPAICEQVGSTVTFRFRIGAWDGASEYADYYAAEFIPGPSGSLGYTVSPWPAPLGGDMNLLLLSWAHGAGLRNPFGTPYLVELDENATEVPGTATQLPPSIIPVPSTEFMGACMSRQLGHQIFYIVREYLDFDGLMWFELHSVATTVPAPDGPDTWWEGYYDDEWRPAYGGFGPVIYPEIRDGIIVIPNPADPDNPWVWATLPPGSGLNDWMQFYIDRDYIRIVYNGRVVLVWRMPPGLYQQMLAGGAYGGFYNPITKQWSPQAPPGTPPFKAQPLTGWAYQVDSRHWVGEDNTDDPMSSGRRIDADDVLLVGNRAVVGQCIQDDIHQAARIEYLAGRILPPVVLGNSDAQLVYDAGYGHYLYPVEEPA